MSLKVFVDSDVVISSLISKKGAAHFLLESKDVECFVSNISVKELEIVVDRLNIDKTRLKNLIRNRFEQVDLNESIKKLKNKFKDYILDEDDAHIVAGAIEAKVKFLTSYNIKDFKIDRIKQDFNIIVITPANYLQYVRGRF